MRDHLDSVSADRGLPGSGLGRRQMIVRASSALAGITVMGLPPALRHASALPASGFTASSPAEALARARQLEQLQLALFQHAIDAAAAGGYGFSAAERASVEQIARHDTAHLAALITGGGAATGTATFDLTGGSGTQNGPFAAALTSRPEFLKLAQLVKDLGVRAYKGVLIHIGSDPALLSAVVRVHAAEARHAGHIRRLRGQTAWIVGASIAGFTTVKASSGFSQADIAEFVYAGEDNQQHMGFQVPGAAAAAMQAFDEPLPPAAAGAVLDFFTV
jgi:hypothetical protein